MSAVQTQRGGVSTRPQSEWFAVHPALGLSIIDHLFNRLDGAYPHKWRSNFPNQQAIDNWAESWVEAFEDEGVTPADVKTGLRECRKRFPWPPSCAEFIQACKPSLDPLMAYQEAITGLQARGMGEVVVWSHPAVFWAANGLKRDLMTQAHGSIKDRWAAALKAQYDRKEWEPIPPPRLALPEPGKSELSREGWAAALAQIGASGVLQRGRMDDCKLWAKRIMARHEAGDTTLRQFQITAARQALNAPQGEDE